MVTDIHRDLLLFFRRLFQRLLFQRLGFLEVFLQQRKQYRIQHNGEDRPRENQILPGLRQQIQRHAQSGQNKGEFTDLCQTGGNGQRRARRVTKQTHQEEGGNRLTKDDNRQRAQHGQRLLDQDQRVEQHPDGDKEQHRKRVTQRQGIVCGAVAQLGFVQHHSGEERTQRKGDIEQLYGTKGDTQRQRQHGKGKQFAGTGRGTAGHDPRYQTAADQHHDGNKCHNLTDSDAHIQRQRGEANVVFFHHSGDSGQQNQRQHHHQVFYNQPANRDLPALAVYQLPLFKRAQQHHGTGG